LRETGKQENREKHVLKDIGAERERERLDFSRLFFFSVLLFVSVYLFCDFYCMNWKVV
jgi:hypothetical protein